jgi:hypothetical protein
MVMEFVCAIWFSFYNTVLRYLIRITFSIRGLDTIDTDTITTEVRS